MSKFAVVNEIKRHIDAWLSLVERCVRDAEVAGSNPVASILGRGAGKSGNIGFPVFFSFGGEMPGGYFSLKNLSAPMIKCKKTPKKKCRFMAERRKKR